MKIALQTFFIALFILSSYSLAGSKNTPQELQPLLEKDQREINRTLSPATACPDTPLVAIPDSSPPSDPHLKQTVDQCISEGIREDERNKIRELEFTDGKPEKLTKKEILLREMAKTQRNHFTEKVNSPIAGDPQMPLNYNLKDLAYAKKADGNIYDGVLPKEPGKYNFVFTSDGRTTFGRVLDKWQYGVRHYHLARGASVLLAGEASIDEHGNLTYNLHDEDGFSVATLNALLNSQSISNFLPDGDPKSENAKNVGHAFLGNCVAKLFEAINSRVKVQMTSEPMMANVPNPTREQVRDQLCSFPPFKANNPNICTIVQYPQLTDRDAKAVVYNLGLKKGRFARFLASLRKTLGKEKAETIKWDDPPLTIIRFPNGMAEINLPGRDGEILGKGGVKIAKKKLMVVDGKLVERVVKTGKYEAADTKYEDAQRQPQRDLDEVNKKLEILRDWKKHAHSNDPTVNQVREDLANHEGSHSQLKRAYRDDAREYSERLRSAKKEWKKATGEIDRLVQTEGIICNAIKKKHLPKEGIQECDFTRDEQGRPVIIEKRAAMGLDVYLKQNPHLPDSERIKLLLHTGEGLKNLQDHGILHGDVKLENIFVAMDDKGQIRRHPDGTPVTVWSDFGGSVDMLNSHLSKKPMFRGTPAYVAPEVFKRKWDGENKKKKAENAFRQDTFSFGKMVDAVMNHGKTEDPFTVCLEEDETDSNTKLRDKFDKNPGIFFVQNIFHQIGNCIDREVREKHKERSAKLAQGPDSPKQQVERLILKATEPDYANRPSTQEMINNLKQISSSFAAPAVQ